MWKLLAERELTFERAFETAQSMEFANKEGIRDVITTGDKSGNKVDKVVGNMVVVFVPAKNMLRQRAGERPHIAKMCNEKCDAHNTRFVEDVSQADSAADEMLNFTFEKSYQ